MSDSPHPRPQPPHSQPGAAAQAQEGQARAAQRRGRDSGGATSPETGAGQPARDAREGQRPRRNSQRGRGKGNAQRRNNRQGRKPSERGGPRWKLSPADRERRAQLVPKPTYDDALPIAASREEIKQAIAEHQVVIIAGETGSGKTTQIPKMCLELGRGVGGMIGHTQPRKIAARSVAERVAEELGVELGRQVGYSVRFQARTGRDTLIKVMTDGILLAEMQRDRQLRAYDTIIIDEAHERSLNIDFILGYLKQLLPQRPDLKVIVTSATIDPERFAEHFSVDGADVPILQVSGRTYPVEVRYRPLTRQDPQGKDVDVDVFTGIVEAVEELWTEPSHGLSDDILVFLPGERDIRDAADALEGMNLPRTEVIPLFARLSGAEQHRVFQPHSGRRIVLATNVAETSLTVPGIRYVIDTGVARISRYSRRTKVQRLPIEPISQASANQRSGRCGRVMDGIAIRLYSEEDFGARPEFTDPEILRTNLASVILRMAFLGLGEITRFPFVDAPDRRQLTDGIRLLEELGALTDTSGVEGVRLTKMGRSIAQFPLDPRLARMVVAAQDEGCVREVAVLAAALTIQDVRERPLEKQTQAQQQHARFHHEDSDFATLLTLWGYLKDKQDELSGSAFRRLCKKEFLHFLRIREWQDLVQQILGMAKDAGLTLNQHPASLPHVHRALLTGLLSHIGMWEERTREYQGARGARFAIQPGSVLHRTKTPWIMAAELVETTRMWARTVCPVNPRDVEQAAAHLVQRRYSEPRWMRSRGAAMADERVTLYGVPLVAGRPVPWGSQDRGYARELFIHHALVLGEWNRPTRGIEANQALVAELRERAERTRQYDQDVSDDVLSQFYDARIPEHVTSVAHFESWWKKARREQPELLTLRVEDVLDAARVDDDAQNFPHQWHSGEASLAVDYSYDVGETHSGVAVRVPVAVLNQVRPEEFSWGIPGFREQLVTAWIKALPKEYRRHCVPAVDFASTVLAEGDPQRDVLDEIIRLARTHRGVDIPRDAFDEAKVPRHLRVVFSARDTTGREIAADHDVSALQQRLSTTMGRHLDAHVATADTHVEVSETPSTTWDVGEIPHQVEAVSRGHKVTALPALCEVDGGVAVRMCATAAEQQAAHHAGVRRLLVLTTTLPWKKAMGTLSSAQRLALGAHPYDSMEALQVDVHQAVADAQVRAVGAQGVRTAEHFAQLRDAAQRDMVAPALRALEDLAAVLEWRAKAAVALRQLTSGPVQPVRDDVQEQLREVVFPGMASAWGVEQLRHAPRWLQGAVVRIEKAPTDIGKDLQQLDVVLDAAEEVERAADALPPYAVDGHEVWTARAHVQELRVSLLAQSLGTAVKVSPQRISKEIRGWAAAP